MLYTVSCLLKVSSGQDCFGIMDYGTFFFTNIASVTVFTVCIALVACYNRRVMGMSWFAGGLIVGLVKLMLQGLEGKVPSVFSSMLANELYLISFMMQLMGVYWFVVRKPMQIRWPWIAVGLLLAAYTVMFLARIPYSGNLINIPFVIVCGATASILLKHRKSPFRAVSRVYAFILSAAMCVAAYRAVLTNLHYMRPWETVHAETDPRWLYSLAVGAFLAVFMVMCDLWFLVTELQWELAQQVRTDPLTGAMNRRAMEEAAKRETARSIRHDRPLCMIVIDIDNFKQLNDTRGHAAGDSALQALVQRVKDTLRNQDLFARTGGEEFAILLPDTPETAGIATAERVRQAIEELEVPSAAGTIRITVSAGVAQLDSSCGGWEELMQRADEAMYEAKKRGRNAVTVRHCEGAAVVST
jgi:diguanylate cyclase (GGDEF)-like protein